VIESERIVSAPKVNTMMVNQKIAFLVILNVMLASKNQIHAQFVLETDLSKIIAAVLMELTKTEFNIIVLRAIINVSPVLIAVKIASSAEEIDKMNQNVLVQTASMMTSSLNFVNRAVFLVIPVIFMVV
jgi:hypothetical protein